MTDIATQWYLAPLWVINALYFGKNAYKNFKKMREDNTKIFPALFWSAASLSAVGSFYECMKNLENTLK